MLDSYLIVLYYTFIILYSVVLYCTEVYYVVLIVLHIVFCCTVLYYILFYFCREY